MWNLVMGGVFSDEEDSPSPIVSPQNADTAGSEAKPRLPSPTRERGDGKEAEIESQKKTLAREARLIHLPQTNIKLEKLPPISDGQVQMDPITPTSPLVPMSLGKTTRSQPTNTLFKKDKEPKFVPYEPYKGAVTPLVPVGRRRKCPGTSKSAVRASKSGSVTPPTSPVPSSSPTYIGKEVSKESSEVLLKTIAELKAKLSESEKQLKIQTQVNAEVKKLLVASVGEDIEAQVDFLTQDKARLSADIHQYASKISRDFEEKEKLSVESNLWKSKFLASSVIVDELARWKAGLMHHSEDFDHSARLLLHENAVLWDSLMRAFSILFNLKTAFDPLGKSPSPAEALSILGLAEYTLKAAQELQGRLIGQKDLKTADFKDFVKPKQIDSPAVETLRVIMNKPICSENSDYSEVASLALTGVARPHLRKLGDILTTPVGFKCCTHCQGNVHNV
eukprot:maker-scaffold34_size539781-snap-gene-0.16 protein:Tk05349 transcript:maker-scaffold34_size539781-snap-gene-0.16-mRNA-1 annotation:"Golgin-45"